MNNQIQAPKKAEWEGERNSFIEMHLTKLATPFVSRSEDMSIGFDAAISRIAKPLLAELKEERRLRKVYEDTAENLAEKCNNLSDRVKELESNLDKAAAVIERKDREISRLLQEQKTLRAQLAVVKRKAFDWEKLSESWMDKFYGKKKELDETLSQLAKREREFNRLFLAAKSAKYFAENCMRWMGSVVVLRRDELIKELDTALAELGEGGSK